MAKRIRYEKTNIPNILASVRTYNTGHAEYRVLLNLNEKKYKIVELPHKNIAAEGEAVSLAMLKIRAKRALTQLGYSFDEEGRDVFDKE